MDIGRVAAELAKEIMPKNGQMPMHLDHLKVRAERIIRDRLRSELEPAREYTVLVYEPGGTLAATDGVAVVRKARR